LLTCKQFLDELSDYLDESASGETRRELEAHLTACPNCWVIADTTRKTVKIYKGMEPQPISEDLRERLLRALDKKMSSGRGRPPSSGAQG
jgi:anti-sigma factor RsiW